MMKRHNTNKYHVIANLSALVYFLIGHFINLPDLVKGFSIGLCIALYPIGLYSSDNDISKLQCFKKNLIKRYI